MSRLRASWRRVLACLVLLACVLAAPIAGTAADPYEINVILSSTGLAAFIGKNEAAGLRVLEAKVNAVGGVRGRPIKFVIQDDQSSPKVAVQLTSALLTKNIPIILGATLVSSCNAMESLMKNGPVLYCFSAGFHPEPRSWAFTSTQSTTDLIADAVRYFRLRGWTKIALITTTDSTGQDGDRGFDEAVNAPENKSVRVVARTHFANGDLSVDAQMVQIKTAGAQALIAWTTGTSLGTILKSANDVGLNIPIIPSAGNLIYSEMEQLSPFIPAAGVYFVGMPCAASGAPDALPRGALKNVVSDYVNWLKAGGVRADCSEAYAWDPALITLSAFKALGVNASAVQIREYIENLHGFAGTLGEYDFRDGSQRGLDGKRYQLVVRWEPAKDDWVIVTKLGGSLLPEVK